MAKYRNAGFVNVGFGNIVNADKIVAIVSPDAAPIKRMVQTAKEEGRSIDATQGRKTKSVLISEDHYLILSALQPDTIGRRLQSERDNLEKDNLEKDNLEAGLNESNLAIEE